MTDSKEESRQNKKPELKQDNEQQQTAAPAGKGDDFDLDDFIDFVSKISPQNLPDPSMCGFSFNPMTMEYEQPCGYGPNGEPEFLDDLDDFDDD